jgi:hypothetical protein
MAMNALLDNGDEVLVPAPDYPLWTAAVSLSGGTPRHYLCDEGAGWLPDLADIRAKITPRTRAIVIINPNNPTGALYPDEVLSEIIEIARQNDLIIYADEVYDKVLYDGASHTSIGALAEDVLTITFNGLSKNYRACGYRAGWMIVSGEKKHARDYIDGLDMLASMRLCANVPGQWGIQTALGGYQSIDDLVAPGGRMCRQRDVAHEADHRDSRRRLRQAEGDAVHVSAPRSEAVSDHRRPGVHRSSCWPRRRCCWCRAPASTGRIPTTSAWSSCRTRTTCAKPSAASRAFLTAIASGMAAEFLLIDVTGIRWRVLEPDWLSAPRECIASCAPACRPITPDACDRCSPTAAA